jgi:hypothetical protein
LTIEFPHEQFADPRWRLNNLYSIVDKSGVCVPFRLNRMQADLLDKLHHSNIVLKSRQMGVTTLICLVYLDRCLFNSNTRAGVIAHTLVDASEIFRTKIQFPYNALPEVLRNEIPTIRDSATELALGNGSTIRVGTSMRGSTLNLLHVSEYAKMCQQFPDKAGEVRAGALNTLAPNSLVVIESTAAGRAGHFYELFQEAEAQQRKGHLLTSLDFRPAFYPWFQTPEYTLPPDGVVIPIEYEGYFDKLRETAGIILTPGQRAWYVRKAQSQLDDMGREFPSTAEEAFQASVEGSYYGTLLAKAELEKRIGDHPAIDGVPVHTAWDLGVGDSTAIWFFQQPPGSNKIGLVACYENSGEGMQHYVEVLRDYAARLGFKYGEHLVPHDARVKEWGSGRTRVEQLRDALDDIRLVNLDKIEDGINAVRATLPVCYFHEAETTTGIRALRNYHREWDDVNGCWKNRPKHDWSSDYADAFRYLAMTWREVYSEPTDGGPDQPPRPVDIDYSRPVLEQVTLDYLWAAEDEWRRPRGEDRY